MWKFSFLLWAVALCRVRGQGVSQQVCPASRDLVEIQPGADIVIGGLFEVRSMGHDGFGCGRPAIDTMQIFEAARFTVNYLNNMNSGQGYLNNGATFGLKAYDTCFSPSKALNSLQMLYPQTTSSSAYCLQDADIITGVVGPLSSWTSMPVSELAGELPVSVISPRAESSELSDKFKYPTFLRTTSSAAVFAKITVELLKERQWQNFKVVYIDDAYGRSGYEELVQAAYNQGFCVSQSIALDKNGDKDAYKAALGTIGTNEFSPVVVLASSVQTRLILEAADEVPSVSNFEWVLSDLDITQDHSTLKRARGAHVIFPRSELVTEFRNYFAGLEASPSSNAVGNPWFEDWFEEKYNCQLTGTLNRCQVGTALEYQNEFVQSPWVVTTIKAVLAYAETIRLICQGQGGGVCTNLRNMSPSDFHNRLKSLDFTIPASFGIPSLTGEQIKFDANGDPEASEASIYNYHNNNPGGAYVFEEVAYFESGQLKVRTSPTWYDSTRTNIITSFQVATCQIVGCENCLLPQRSVSFRYKPGDVVIASLVDAHQHGRAPFTCGDGIASRLASLVAVEWAITEYVTRNPGKLRQVSLGSLVADICQNSFVAGGFLTDLLSGNNQLRDPSGAIVPASNVHAFVDQTESMQAKAITGIVSEYMIPELQTSATSPNVAMQAMTPYFARAVPDDEIFYTAVASLLQRLEWKHVQMAMHMSGRYYKMAQIFKQKTASHGICIVGMANLDGDDANRYSKAVDELLSRDEAPVVVVIGDMDDVRGLLSAINNKGVVGQLQLVAGTDKWARNPAYIQGLESAAVGSISIDLEMSPDVAFGNWLKGQTQAERVAHPFLRELVEITNQCSLDPSTRGVYARTCTAADNLDVYQGKTPYVIQSVFTVLDKLHEVIVEVCKTTSYTGLCSDFRSALDIGRRLGTKLQNVAKEDGYGIRNGEGITNYNFYVYRQATGFVEFGEFDTEYKRLGAMTIATLGTRKQTTCSGVCMECQYMFSMQNGLFVPGDWLIAGSFSASYPGPQHLQPYVCGDVKMAYGPQYTTAMMYALNQVNSGKAPVSVRGVKFGGLVLDHCNNVGRAELMVSDIYSGFFSRMGVDQSRILAWMTDNTGATHGAAELLDPLGVAMVSPSASAANLMDYPTFHRTMQGDTTVATALVKIVKSLGFPYIQVAYSANSYGHGGLSSMQAVTQSEGICITHSVELEANADDTVAKLLASETQVVVLFLSTADMERLLTAITNNAQAKDSLLILVPERYTTVVEGLASQLAHPVISLQLQRFTVSDYNDYLDSAPISNPYFAHYYMNIKRCSLPGYSNFANPCPTPLEPLTSDPSYVEDHFLLPTINSVYAVVDALDRTVKEYCGDDYSEPCIDFLSATDKRQRFNRNLNSANFIDESQNNFRFLEREGNTAFDILQSSAAGIYRKVGSYAGVSLDLEDAVTAMYPDVESTCSAPCLDCIMRGLNFSHTPGDVYIAGMFDVHARFLSPFTCGRIQTLHGFLLLEAFHYALNQVNSKQGQFADILQGTSLGGVGLDACGSQVRGGYLVSNIHNGFTSLARDGQLITPSIIDAYIGPYGSSASKYLARILTDLEIPQISYAASSEELSDERIYPYFYRTVPSDNNQVEAMLKFLDKMHIRYVQILYEDNSNGISAKDYFVEQAAKYQICVAQTVDYPDLGVVSLETSNAVVAELIDRPAANTVVTFLSTGYINSVLKAVGRSPRAANKLRFIGSDAWADNQDAILGAEKEALGSITVKLDADDIEDFERYINSKTLANSAENPWFEEYYQEIHNCYTSKTNTMGYPRPCPLTPSNTINSPGYQQDPGVLYVINAVYSAAFAIHETLEAKCGMGYTTVCQAYRSDPNRRLYLSDSLADVKFVDPAGNHFMFVNRSGVAGYRFNSIDPGLLGGVTYRQVGGYNVSTGMITVNSDYTSDWDSDCDRKDACAECPTIRDRGLRYVFHKGPSNIPDDATTVIAFFDIHKQGVDPYRCGELNVPGFQQFLGFFYSLENVLADVIRGTQIVNGKYDGIRVLAIDTCSNPLRVDQDLFGLLQGTGICNTIFDTSFPISVGNIGGVITMGDYDTLAASRLLEAPEITYVSPMAISTLLDNSEHLARTIAPISAHVQFLVSLLDELGWTYVDVVHEDTGEGFGPWSEFEFFANEKKICRGISLDMSLDMTDAAIEDALDMLNGELGSKVVVLFGSFDFVHRVIRVAHHMAVADEYVWLLGVEWDLEAHLDQIVPEGAELRVIATKRITDRIASFDAWVNDMTYDNVHNPLSTSSVPLEWYDEFYQIMHDCTLSDAVKPINKGKPECPRDMGFSNVAWQQDKYVLNTVAASYAVNRGLRDFLLDCGTSCASGQPLDESYRRMSIRDKILDVEWELLSEVSGAKGFRLEDLVDLKLEFSEYRWWNSGFHVNIWHLEKSEDGVLDREVLQLDDIKDILSICLEGDLEGACGCTFEVGGQEEELDDGPDYVPKDHRNYYKYESNDVDKQYDWPVWAIAVAVLTCVGLVITIILFLILLFAYPKRGGTSILGYMVIFGIILIYGINFAFFLRASDATCGIRRFLMGVVYVITFAPLLIKSIDNWRFSHVDYADQRYSGISSWFVLFLAALGIVLIQCIIPIIWLILEHPTAREWAVYVEQEPPLVSYWSFRHDNYWCDPPDDYDLGLVLSMTFVVFIIIITAVFSALAYDTERNNRESRWTLFCCVATAGCFMVWMIVSTNSDPPYRDPAVAIANFVNATVLMIIMPMRKTSLMCKAMRQKGEKEEAMEVVDRDNNPYDLYSNSYNNPTFELTDYNQEFKPSEY